VHEHKKATGFWPVAFSVLMMTALGARFERQSWQAAL